MELVPLNIEELKPSLNRVVVDTREKLQLVTDFIGRVKVFGFDVETNVAPKFHQRKTRTIQLGDRNEQYIIDLKAFAVDSKFLANQGNFSAPEWAVPIVEVLRPALESPEWTKVGHNLQFDYETLWWNLGLRTQGFYDTQRAEEQIYAGLVPYYHKSFWALDDLVARYCRLKISKSAQTSFNLFDPLTPEQIDYCALDCRLPLAVMSIQSKTLTRIGVEFANKIENNAIMAFGDMHLNGIYLDRSMWLHNVEQTELRHQENLDELDRYFLPIVGRHPIPITDDQLKVLDDAWRLELSDRELRKSLREQHKEAKKLSLQNKKFTDLLASYQGIAAINYESNPQLIQALRKMGFDATILPDTNDRNLEKRKNFPVIEALRNYRETAKILKSSGRDFVEEHIDPVTGRVHSWIKSMGAETGRTSSVKPNIQNITKKSNEKTKYEVAWRHCYRAQPGYLIITSDYNGCELRILAEASQEPAFVDAFRKDWDVHSVGAEIIFGKQWKDGAEPECKYYFKADHQKCKCKIHKQLRDQIKAINFGIAYGMEAQKLADGIGITKQEASKLLRTYRETFPKLIAYLEKLGNIATSTFVARTLSGRARFFRPPTWEQARESALLTAKKKKMGVATDKDVKWAFRSMLSAIEREGKNSPIQGTNADLAKIAMYYLWEGLYKFGAKLVNFVHDEFVVECPEGCVEECKDFIESCMIRGGEALIRSIPVVVDSNIYPYWFKD